MFVTKRDNREAAWVLTKWIQTARKLANGLDVNVDVLSRKLVPTLIPGMPTREILEQTARVAAQLVNMHPDYSILAGRFLVAQWRKTCPSKFSDCIKTLFAAGLITKELSSMVTIHQDALDNCIVANRDDNLQYFGIKTLERSYLLKNVNGQLIETAQYMYMRVALGIHQNNVQEAMVLYNALSEGLVSHASPTLFNAGTPHPQLASCFLLSMDGDQDSITSIYSTLGKCADISKYAGGIGLHVHTVRAAGSHIKGTNGTSNGLVPMLKVFDATAKYVDQGGNKRPGAIAIYLEPWHADIYEFLDLKLPTGVDELRARDLFYGLWVPDLFMKRVAADAEWTLFDPKTAPGLDRLWGTLFEEQYEQYERSRPTGCRTVSARELWSRIMRAQKETGTPYILFKDHCNRKSNQKHLGTIASSNLCVAGDTMILTEKGPICIKEIVDGPDVTTMGDDPLAYEKTKAHIAQLEAIPHRSTDEEQTLRAVRAKFASLSPPKTSKKFDVAPVKVWNGQNWSEVEPRQTNTNQKLLRVTTSHGSVLDCTLTHKFILADGTRVEAASLTLGSQLAVVTPVGTPVIYPGDPAQKLLDDVAFRRGFVYAYAILKKGTEHISLAPPQFKVPFVLVNKEQTSAKTLEVFQYDRAAATAQFPDLDHELLAPLAVPPSDQSLQTRLQGPVESRESWVHGFLAGIGGQLAQARASYSFLHKAWLMLRSVGRDVRLVPFDHAKGLWQLKDGDEATRHPEVVGLQFLPGLHNTYCFTEPEQHAGVFNELLTGQCAEIIEYSDPQQIAVCNLASICLPKCVQNGKFDFARLRICTRILVQSLNNIIDITLYARPEMKLSNLMHRPIGIGVQGLADVFAMLHYSWESPEAAKLNREIFENMYYAALDESCSIAQTHGPYSSFQGSPAQQGILQFHMWNEEPENTANLNWESLINDIKSFGLRNSLLLACMPTASTAQILGNNESIEPFTSNIYTRSVLSGEFQVVNRHLVADLQKLGLWDEGMQQDIIRANGSVQNISSIPDNLKQIYKTVWEIPQRVLINMAADRGAFICQSQSFNLHMRAPTDNQLYNALFYAWEKGLKTGMYYLRTRPAVDPIKFTLQPEAVLACSRDNPGNCVMCSA